MNITRRGDRTRSCDKSDCSTTWRNLWKASYVVTSCYFLMLLPERSFVITWRESLCLTINLFLLGWIGKVCFFESWSLSDSGTSAAVAESRRAEGVYTCHPMLVMLCNLVSYFPWCTFQRTKCIMLTTKNGVTVQCTVTPSDSLACGYTQSWVLPHVIHCNLLSQMFSLLIPVLSVLSRRMYVAARIPMKSAGTAHYCMEFWAD